jgi:transaldolase/glucose-6-phosphate isomerase
VLDAAAEMQHACSSGVAESNNPGLWLGTVLAVLAAQGRDKLTLITSPEIAPLSGWIEQLIAASTGKAGKGIVPVVGETLGTPFQYDDDRLIVYLRLDGAADDLDEGIRRLQQAGHPVVSIDLRDRRDIGAEYYRWMFATAIAGMVMEINPFEEPDVAEGKQSTASLLETFEAQGVLSDETPVLVEEDVALYADASLDSLLDQLQSEHEYQTTPLSGKLAAFLSLARSGDYVCLLAYVPPHPEIVDALEGIRARIRHILKRAVTLGYGPRSLHSSSQLHRGGPNTGVFILFTATNEFDLSIPGMPFGFSALKRAEAIGDLEAMRARGRRIVRVDLGADLEAGLRKVTAALEAAAEKRE